MKPTMLPTSADRAAARGALAVLKDNARAADRQRAAVAHNTDAVARRAARDLDRAAAALALASDRADHAWRAYTAAALALLDAGALPAPINLYRGAYVAPTSKTGADRADQIYTSMIDFLTAPTASKQS